MSDTKVDTVQENLELVRETYEAFGRGDMIAVMGAFMPDIEWNAPAVLPHGASARGVPEVGEFFHGLANTWEAFGIEIDGVIASGDRVIALGRAAGTLRGRQTGYGFAHAWTVKDGLLSRLDEYVDPAPEIYAG